MKKQAYKKPSNKTQSLKPANIESEGALETVANRKASTPKNNCTSGSVSPDISCIQTDESIRPSTTGTQVSEKSMPSKKLLKKPAASKTENLAEKLDLEYTRYLQSMFLNKLNEDKSFELNSNLEDIQKRLEKNKNILQQTTERLKNVNFNKDIDVLHALNIKNYGEALEKLNSSNCKEYLSSLTEKLKHSTNQLKVQNIELPEGGAAQLVQVISDTVEACEKLKSERDDKTWKSLRSIEESNRSTALAISKCKEKLCATEELLLTYSTAKICNKD